MARSAFDGPEIFIADQNQGNEDLNFDSMEYMRQIFKEFLRVWTEDNIPIYREQLKAVAKLEAPLLEIDIDHMNAYHTKLFSKLKETPLSVLSELERVAYELALELQIQEPPHYHVSFITGERPLMLRELHADMVGRLVVVPGIVVAASKPNIKAVKLAAQCKGCNNVIVFSVKPGFDSLALPRQCSAPRPVEGVSVDKCPMDPYVIVPEKCEYIDQQTLKLQELPECVPTGEIPRTFTVVLDRCLVDRVVPGNRMKLIAIYTTFKRQEESTNVMHSFLHALGLMQQSDMKAFSYFSPEEEERMVNISRLPNLYERLTNSIAPGIYGSPDVKKALACLLFGGSRKVLPDGMKLRGDINVLLLGDPSTAKSQFLKFIERAAPVSVYTSGKGSSAAGLTAAVMRDPHTHEFQLEGGAMVLADGGVVCIDEFDKMRGDDRVAIHEAMEQQTISVAKAGITTVLNSRTAVLAAANPRRGSYDDQLDLKEQMEFQTTILSRFDCIFLVRDIRDEANDTKIASHVVRMHAGSKVSDEQSRGEISLLEIKRYVQYARSRCAPSLTAEAGRALQNFYVQDRRRKSSGIPITVRQLEAIIRMSEAQARIHLSSEVLIHHVEEAHRIFEVSTLSAAEAGVSEFASSVSSEIVEKVQEAIIRRLPIGGKISSSKLETDLVARFNSAFAVQHAIVRMVSREELKYVRGRHLLERVR
jgi:DNA replication licensing factor MCM5